MVWNFYSNCSNGGTCDIRILKKCLFYLTKSIDFGKISDLNWYTDLENALHTKTRNDAMILMKLKFLFKIIFKNSSNILIKALGVTNDTLKMNVNEKLSFISNTDKDTCATNTSIFKSFCDLYEIYNKIKSLTIEDKVKKQAKKFKSKEVAKDIQTVIGMQDIDKNIQNPKLTNQKKSFEVTRRIGLDKLRKATDPLLDSKIYRFIPKGLAKEYQENTNIKWSERDIESVNNQIKETIEKLTNETNGYIVQLGKCDANWETRRDFNESTSGNYAALCQGVIECLNAGNIKSTYEDLNKMKKQITRLIQSDGEKDNSCYNVACKTLLFVIRMLKNQIKKLQEYNIFPNLKLEKKLN